MANTVIAVSQCTAYPSPSVLASRFFNTNEEIIVLSFPIFACSVGMGFGLWFPSYIMDGTMDFDTVTKRKLYCDIFGMFSAVPSLLFILPCVSNYPIIPPQKTFDDMVNPEESEIKNKAKKESEQIHVDPQSDNYFLQLEDECNRSFTWKEKKELKKNYCLNWINSNKLQF